MEKMTTMDPCFKEPQEIGKAFSYMMFGFVSVVCNMILIAAITKDKVLRVEFRVIVALAFADFIEAFATLFGGTYRLAIFLTDSINVLVPSLQCMLLPHSWMWRWSDFATSAMLIVLSIDRLISVLYPLVYLRNGTRYGNIMIIVVCLCSSTLHEIANFKREKLVDILNRVKADLYFGTLTLSSLRNEYPTSDLHYEDIYAMYINIGYPIQSILVSAKIDFIFLIFADTGK
ncbi:hypothetical protein AB6A40_006763 [Gnathostoma spinigerum]|uniref:G_PROTEIN_RECEP_F1_2 domain-containing protein n=1 Tax=Gnathostoma spinigerum TaxID=75299 RepID=A0ABD6EJA6_9BILA